MKHIAFITLLALLVPELQAKTLIDGIAANVDGTAILVSTIRAKVATGPLVMISDYPVGPGSPTWERGLQDEINKTLMIQSARDFGVTIDAAQVEPEIEKFVARQSSAAKAAGQGALDIDQLKKLLSEQGKSWESYKREFADQMLLQEFQKRALLPTIKATDKDLKTFYRQVGGKGDMKSQAIDALRIVVDSESKAKSLHKKLEGGADFIEIAKNHSTSEDPTKIIKSLKLSDLPTAMSKKLSELKVGDISPPIAASGGLYFIFKVEGQSVSEVTQEYKSKELVSATHTWIEEKRRNSNIKILVKNKS